MSKVIMVGCDLHDRNMLLRYSAGKGKPRQYACANDAEGRVKMIDHLQAFAKSEGAERIVFVYEASGQGYGLCDLLHDNGIECHVLSPTHLPKTAKRAKQKTDPKDAQMLLDQVRGFVLAGTELPVVWTPPKRLRDDRELVRARIDAAMKRRASSSRSFRCSSGAGSCFPVGTASTGARGSSTGCIRRLRSWTLR
jgi:transposase